MAWFHCEIVKAGPAEDGTIYLALRDTADNPGWSDGRWFMAVDNVKREMLATALSAMATGYPVDAALADPPDEYTRCNRLYIVRP
jgi:hypothetical protein